MSGILEWYGVYEWDTGVVHCIRVVHCSDAIPGPNIFTSQSPHLTEVCHMSEFVSVMAFP